MQKKTFLRSHIQVKEFGFCLRELFLMYFLPDNPLHMFFFLQRNCHALIVVRRFFDLEGHFQLSLYCLILESGEGNDFHCQTFLGGGGS